MGTERVGIGRLPFDRLWRKDLLDGYLLLEGEVPVHGPFFTETDAQFANVYMSAYNPTIEFSVGLMRKRFAQTEFIYPGDLIQYVYAKRSVEKEGIERAKTLLALCYAWGHGVKRDTRRARELLDERTAAGDANAVRCRQLLKQTFGDLVGD